MTTNTDFLKVYNATFDWIETHYGHEALDDYWKAIAPIALYDLVEKAKEAGVVGCAKYWRETLSAEGVDFVLIVNDGKYLEIEVKDCASMERIGTPCRSYCQHCDVMYRTVLEPLGLTYEHKKTGAKSCRLRVTHV